MSDREIVASGSQRILSGEYLRCPNAMLITVNQADFQLKTRSHFFFVSFLLALQL